MTPRTKVRAKERGNCMPTTARQTEGHYSIQEVPFGTVYRWHPNLSVWECGANHKTVAAEEPFTRRLADEALHPWRYVEDREDVGFPC